MKKEQIIEAINTLAKVVQANNTNLGNTFTMEKANEKIDDLIDLL